ncbi:restriction endonuclease subunit S [Pseudoclavibacter sp. VKM Ac-2888]|uniref:restriction endonuclease subunit S n=1 Tax=Pseudoclavibacter sp. VKM Ac-2888 TaxID=2783830 RepID=UPI00188B85EC|nr:restriction endonuclease subunit S [Pseudoclavibacter sp. VKM Ac-2888]MBF4549393.1 restriction endonuclease subunit S [Pseudoclavibacter sp. VKM Ac-2888]
MSAYDDLTFAPVLITDVFDTMSASSAWFDKNKLRKGPGSYSYVSRSGLSNGFESEVGRQDLEPNAGNAVTIGVDTQTVFYQPAPFYTSVKIQVLRHELLNEASGLVLVSLLRSQMRKFAWGNGASLVRLAATRIMAPVTTDDDGEQAVDWVGMTRLGEELMAQAITRTHSARTSGDADANAGLPNLRFAPMFVIDVPGRQRGIFHAHKGKRLITAHRKPGRMPFVAGSRKNNSIADLADIPALFPGGWITLIYNGDGGTGHAKYQPMSFNASDDVTALEPVAEGATEGALLMLVTMLTQQCVPKFGFGYKLTLHRLGRQRIMVPVVTDDFGDEVIDWESMTLYGKVLRARAERRLSMPTTVSG